MIQTASQPMLPFYSPGLLIFLGLFFHTVAFAESIRIATWNLNNLHYAIGQPLRSGAPVREKNDYQTLRKYVDRLDADIVAFQEVNGPKAARLVFAEAMYSVYFSGRYVEDVESNRRSDRIYTGFAIRRNVFKRVSKRDFRELSGRRTNGRVSRWGTDILVQKNGKYLRLLNIHLKSGCSTGSLQNPKARSCLILGKQIKPLEAWIDQRAREPVPFVVLGDFNRGFDLHGQGDHFWADIDDHDPPGLDLWRLPYRQASKCWRGTENYHRHPIDFMVFDNRAWNRVDRHSFRQIDFELADRQVKQATPSDHCPIVVNIAF